MSLTIIQQPSKFSPAYNPLMFVSSGTNNTQTNYKYIFDVFFSGASAYTFRTKVLPRPDGYGLFDASPIVRDYVGSNIAIQISPNEGFKKNSKSYQEFSVQFGEEYGSPFVDYPNLASSGVIYAFNGVFDFLDFSTFNTDTYVIQKGKVRNFLTNIPRANATVIGSSENAWLYMQTDTINAINVLNINTNDGGLFQITNPYNLLASEDERFLRIPCGTKNLNLTGQTIITANTTSYTLVIKDDSGITSTTETFSFKVQDPCTPYTLYRLHWLNKLGGFDSFTFSRLSQKLTDITRPMFKKSSGSVTNKGWSYNNYDRGENNYHNTFKDKLVLNSDFITEAQATWLKELMTSPVVYLDDATYGLVAVNITDGSYESFQKTKDKLFNLVINLVYSQDNSVQQL